MAFVLVAHRNADMREDLAKLLTERGHVVTRLGDGTLALAALWVSTHPLIVVLDDGLAPLNAADVLELAAAGEPPVARHQFVVMSTTPSERLRAAVRALPGASLIPPPVDPDVIDLYVERAAEHLPVWSSAPPPPASYPERVAHLVS